MGPIVLLSVDSLRNDIVTKNNLPRSLPVLSEDFARFTNCYSHGVATPFAFPGIVSSSLPTGDGLLPDSAKTVSELVVDRYSSAFTNNGHLNERRGYNRGFDSFESSRPPDDLGIVHRLKQIQIFHRIGAVKKAYDTLSDLYRDSSSNPGTASLPVPYQTADVVSDFVIRQLETYSNPFIWGHYMDPHWPYHPDTSLDADWEESIETLVSIGDRFTEGDASAVTDAELDNLDALYRGNVRYFDRELSRLLSWLREQQWYEKALIVLVSDHGELFGEDGYCFHPWDAEPIDELINTPLFVKYPDGESEGETFEHNVGHWDILRTIAHVSDGTDAQLPEYTHRLGDRDTRQILSVSNTVIRLTEDDGRYLRYRDGESKVIGMVSESGQSFAESVDFPACRSNSGRIIGVEGSKRQRAVSPERQQQLEDLGYK